MPQVIIVHNMETCLKSRRGSHFNSLVHLSSEDLRAATTPSDQFCCDFTFWLYHASIAKYNVNQFVGGKRKKGDRAIEPTILKLQWQLDAVNCESSFS